MLTRESRLGRVTTQCESIYHLCSRVIRRACGKAKQLRPLVVKLTPSATPVSATVPLCQVSSRNQGPGAKKANRESNLSNYFTLPHSPKSSAQRAKNGATRACERARSTFLFKNWSASRKVCLSHSPELLSQGTS